MTGPPRDRRIPDLVSLSEAAKMLVITRQGAHKLAVTGKLLGAQVGGTWVFRRVVVEKYAIEHGKNPEPEPAAT